MPSLRVRVVGVGDAFTARYHNACFVLEAEGMRLLIDAPPALARALADLGDAGGERLSLDDVDHVLITHLHGDHVGGLEQLLYWRRFVTQKKCTVHAIPEVLAGLWEHRLRGGMDTLMDAAGDKHAMRLDDYAVIEPLPTSPGPARIGPFELEWRPTVHHIPTSALRVRVEGSRARFGYSADTAFDRSLVEWLAESELFFHETNLGTHTPLASLAALPEALRARMRLIHYPDFHDVEGSPIPCVREREHLDVG